MIRRTEPTMTALRALHNNGTPKEYHGYDLAKQLHSHQTAYAILRNLEAHGLVAARWGEANGRARKYYKLTSDGLDYAKANL